MVVNYTSPLKYIIKVNYTSSLNMVVDFLLKREVEFLSSIKIILSLFHQFDDLH